MDGAVAFATEKHAGQIRKTGEEYIIHPLAVRKHVAGLGLSEVFQDVAVLHDVIEDCGVSVEELSELFGEDVAFMVNSLSKRPKSLYLDPENMRDRRLEDYLFSLRQGIERFPELLIIKICDQLNNLDSFHVFDEFKLYSKLDELEFDYIPFYVSCDDLIPEYLDDIYDRLMTELFLRVKNYGTTIVFDEF